MVEKPWVVEQERSEFQTWLCHLLTGQASLSVRFSSDLLQRDILTIKREKVCKTPKHLGHKRYLIKNSKIGKTKRTPPKKNPTHKKNKKPQVIDTYAKLEADPLTAVVLNWGDSASPLPTPRDIWQCLETFLVVIIQGCHWHLVGRGQRCNTLQCTGQSAKTNNFLAQNINSAKIEKFCPIAGIPKYEIWVSYFTFLSPRFLIGNMQTDLWPLIIRPLGGSNEIIDEKHHHRYTFQNVCKSTHLISTDVLGECVEGSR